MLKIHLIVCVELVSGDVLLFKAFYGLLEGLHYAVWSCPGRIKCHDARYMLLDRRLYARMPLKGFLERGRNRWSAAEY